MTTVMVSCGEPSGDLYAGALAAEIRRLEPGAHVFGLGGDRLAQAGADVVGDYRGLAVTGLVEALRVVPRSVAMYRRLIRVARARRPGVIVIIDFPDFNLRLAAALKRLGVPVVYYVPPQLWAWRAGRIRTIARLADRVLVIFPFEAELYQRAGIPVSFVGHPLLDLARASAPREAFLAGLGLRPDAPTVALLPGSRPNELRSILPALAGAVPLIASRCPGAQFVVARAPRLDTALFSPLGRAGAVPLAVVEAQTDDVLAAADVVLTASGTATVQAAIHLTPMVILYRVSPVTYRLGRPLVRVDTFGMANLVAGRRVVPELIQDDLSAGAIADEAVRFLSEPDYAARTRAALADVREKLGGSGASRRAAEAVLAIARSGRAPSDAR